MLSRHLHRNVIFLAFLFIHAFVGFVKIVQMLVEKGAEVNVVSRDGFSVLDAASKATKGSNFNLLSKNCTNFFKNHHQKE